MPFTAGKIGLIAAFATMTNSAGLAQSRQQEPTLCRAEEQIIFSCGVAGQKIASVCATNKVSKTSGYFQYRFGKAGKIELQYPADLSNSVSKFRFSGSAMSGGGRYHLRFTNEGYEYIVYDTQSRGAEWAGILVRKGGKVASHLKCRIGENSHLSSDAFHIPEPEPFEDIDTLP